MDLVKPPKTLQVKVEFERIVCDLVGKIKGMCHLTSPTSIELLHYLSTLVENVVTKKQGIIKMDVLLAVVRIIFPQVSDDEIKLVISIVEHLLSLKVIKKIPLLKYAGIYGKEILKKVFSVTAKK